MAIYAFCESGYDWIGMDHFARSDDELSIAARERRLHRNFMGYTIRPAPHQLAFGMSGISDLAGRFAQNDAKLGNYQKTLDAGHLPIVRGMQLSDSDKLQRRVIMHLMCNLELPYELTREEFGVGVQEVFSDALARIKPLEEEGFVVFEPDRLTVTTLGRYFLRNISMEFDSYLQQKQDRPLFSKTI
jgi:oxygen-independent coproporphyrinogen-3 oxidase